MGRSNGEYPLKLRPLHRILAVRPFSPHPVSSLLCASTHPTSAFCCAPYLKSFNGFTGSTFENGQRERGVLVSLRAAVFRTKIHALPSDLETQRTAFGPLFSFLGRTESRARCFRENYSAPGILYAGFASSKKETIVWTTLFRFSFSRSDTRHGAW